VGRGSLDQRDGGITDWRPGGFPAYARPKTPAEPMDDPPANAVTRLLLAWSDGDPAARDALLPLVYPELRRVARQRLRHERPGHTLQPTALVHEAYMKLVGLRRMRWQDRAHFFAVASRLMRRILVDHARRRAAAKRGGGRSALTLRGGEGGSPETELDLLALDEALARLAVLDPRQERLTDLRFFAGLDVEETAEVLGVSPATVKREWRTAKAWLYRELRGGA
jgi:RNA polymerase sigma factor (TIGR02999 family)